MSTPSTGSEHEHDVSSRRRWEQILAFGPEAAAAAGLQSEAAIDEAVDEAVRTVRNRRRG